ncbi:hypothetical protein [Weissella kandleri]|uniref:hypothetical protein n=1 Tax=Weissella kandleri TaxID=1616 RepID=UPI00070BF7BD|nr:hypothetical protein [Weissella kandleri]
MIAKLSPLALLVLQRNTIYWPIMKLPKGGGFISGGVLSGDHSEYIAQELLKSGKFNNISKMSLGLAIKELEANGLCFTSAGNITGTPEYQIMIQEVLTEAGKDVYDLIK